MEKILPPRQISKKSTVEIYICCPMIESHPVNYRNKTKMKNPSCINKKKFRISKRDEYLTWNPSCINKKNFRIENRKTQYGDHSGERNRKVMCNKSTNY